MKLECSRCHTKFETFGDWIGIYHGGCGGLLVKK